MIGMNMYCWNNKCLMYNKAVVKSNINIQGFKVCELCYDTVGINSHDPISTLKKIEVNVLEMGAVIDKSSRSKMC